MGNRSGQLSTTQEEASKSTRQEPSKLNIRCISTDEDTTNESTMNDGGSPVFGQAASKTTVNIQKALNRSQSAKKSVESPCLFDEEDGGKHGEKIKEDDLNLSYDGLNIKRKSSRRPSSKIKSPVSKEDAKSKTQRHTDKLELKNSGKTKSPNKRERAVLKSTDNISNLDESKSPSVLSGKLIHVQRVDDLNDTTSPSVLTGKIKHLVENSDKNEQWLNTTPNRNTPNLPRIIDKDGVNKTLDIEDEMEMDNSPAQRTRSRRNKKSLLGDSSSPLVNGKKLVQSKITQDFFKKPKIDLTLDPDFNGGILNNSFSAQKALTAQEKEDLEFQEAIKRSLEETCQGQMQGQGHSDLKSQVLDVGSFSQMTGPAFTSTPCIDPKKNSENCSAKETFKKPPIPVKQTKTPERNKILSENDSPRRSPRLNRTRSSSSDSSSPENVGQRQRSRKQLDLEPETQGQPGLGQITMAVSSDLNGSIDPNLRFSEFDHDGDESHLLLRSGASSKTDAFSRTGAFNITESGKSSASLKSDVMSRTGLYSADSEQGTIHEENGSDNELERPGEFRSHNREGEDCQVKYNL